MTLCFSYFYFKSIFQKAYVCPTHETQHYLRFAIIFDYRLLNFSSEPTERSEAEIVQERRDLAVEFIFCLVLIEVLRQLTFHPGHEDLVGFIEAMAFRHFKFREGYAYEQLLLCILFVFRLAVVSGGILMSIYFRCSLQTGPNAGNIHIVADLYAEVIGALAQSRFMSVRKKFMTELKELLAKEPSPHTTQSIISLLMGMKFFRVKVCWVFQLS